MKSDGLIALMSAVLFIFSIFCLGVDVNLFTRPHWYIFTSPFMNMMYVIIFGYFTLRFGYLYFSDRKK